MDATDLHFYMNLCRDKINNIDFIKSHIHLNNAGKCEYCYKCDYLRIPSDSYKKLDKSCNIHKTQLVGIIPATYLREIFSTYEHLEDVKSTKLLSFINFIIPQQQNLPRILSNYPSQYDYTDFIRNIIKFFLSEIPIDFIL